MSTTVRPYQSCDRDAVRAICCDTGFMGKPIDQVFNDRDSFADFFTRYYTDFEPDNALVAVDGEQVIGYLITCAHYSRYPACQLWIVLRHVFPRTCRLLLTGGYDKSSRQFLIWFLTRSWRETPKAPRRSAHFHMNIRPAYRTGSTGLCLLNAWSDLLKKQHIKTIYAQIQARGNRRPVKVFERMGFTYYDKRKVTKFSTFNQEPVYVVTYVRTV